MTIFHRVTCITAIIIFCHLLGINLTIKPLPSQGLWTLCFTQLLDILPTYVKGFLILTIIILLAFSAITLKLQATAFVISFLIIELGLRVSMTTLALNDQTSFYICIVETKIDPQLKINYFKAILAGYVDSVTQALAYNPVLLQAFKDNVTYHSSNLILLTQMDNTQLAAHAKFITEYAYMKATNDALRIDLGTPFVPFSFAITIILYSVSCYKFVKTFFTL